MSDDIVRKSGNVMVRTFRKIYGDDFAGGVGPTTKLSVALQTLDPEAKKQLEKDGADGALQDKIKAHCAL